ncbi:MAG: hypothetical protein DRI23_05615 [Candidatus Cloacimonadota bacterium]|nr:MAG: hypothetical protein DRI23_05615 [Candidatus Cloacimonadota bacterium]
MAIELVKLYKDNGTFIKDADVTGSTFSTIVDQGVGSLDIKGKSQDDAGNLSGFGSTINYYAGCNNTPLCDLLDDTGKSSTDNLTNDTTPRIAVKITLPIPTGCSQVALSSVQKLELWHKVGEGTYAKIADLTSITRDGNDSFSSIHQFVSELAEGDHYFKAIWVDSQDDTSSYGAELHIVVDSSAPNAPTITVDDGSVFVKQTVTITGSATE